MAIYLDVALIKRDLLPKFLRHMGTLYGLHVEITHPLVLLYGRILSISQWTRASVAEARHIILVPAEVLRYRPIS